MYWNYLILLSVLFFLISTTKCWIHYGIKVAEIRVVTDCAVKETEGILKGVFDVEKHHDFLSYVNPKIILAFTAAVKACVKQFDIRCCHAKH